MENNSFEQKVRNIDWAKYLAPEYFDPEKMSFNPSRPVSALIKLSQFNSNDSVVANDLSSEILFAIGNDHRGTYYPVALEAIDLIIEIEKYSEKEEARKFARYILNDLYYFELEMGGVDGMGNDHSLYDAISDLIEKKLKPYSDENLE